MWGSLLRVSLVFLIDLCVCDLCLSSHCMHVEGFNYRYCETCRAQLSQASAQGLLGSRRGSAIGVVGSRRGSVQPDPKAVAASSRRGSLVPVVPLGPNFGGMSTGQTKGGGGGVKGRGVSQPPARTGGGGVGGISGISM
jgi:hypothetical protein